jgi:hypothetical protein
VDRTIKREPPYRFRPQYCLLVFGPEAKTRVWLVFHGDVVYVDRNSSGDLTEEGKRVTANVTELTTLGIAFHQQRHYWIGKIVESNGRTRHTRLQLTQFVPKKDFTGVSKANAGIQAEISKDRERLWVSLSGLQDDELREHGGLTFANRPKDAPIFHLHGPLTFGLWSASLTRGSAASELRVTLGTAGLVQDAWAYRDYQGIPDHLHPVAIVTFPNADPKGSPIPVKTVLDQRC